LEKKKEEKFSKVYLENDVNQIIYKYFLLHCIINGCFFLKIFKI
jgi:hypothetical protein